MKEVGIDISHQKSKEITEDMMRNSSKIVNMGCMDKKNPVQLFFNNVLDWNIEDPKGKSVEKVREIRDEIEQRVKELVAGLKTNQEINIYSEKIFSRSYWHFHSSSICYRLSCS